MTEATTTRAGGRRPARSARRGESFGRYLVLEELGRGGMGVVYAAFDPELDRRVALKVWWGAAPDDGLGLRMLREAKSLAQLSHPNVVTVYDVGQRDDAVFIAMELVQGGTLAAWLETRPPARQKLRAFEQAARGLDAAHRAGLVHGDFKPSNVLRTGEGLVKVADFGLAARVADGLAEVAGTPHYMAPEVVEGEGASPHSDQYALCVALRDALGDDATARVRAAIERGLEDDPSRRHDSMSALLQVLSERGRTRWVWGVAGAGGVAVLAAAMWPRPEPEVCGGGERAWRGVWDGPSRARLEAAAASADAVFAQDSARRVADELDGFVERWTHAHRTACERATGPNDALYAQRLRCLERGVQEVRSLTGALETAGADAWARGVQAALELGDPSDCTSDEARPTAMAPVPAGAVARLSAARDRLAQARVMELLGLYDQGLESLSSLGREVEDIGYGPLRAELLLRRGRLLEGRGDVQPALSTLKEAYWVAASASHREIEAEAATMVAFMLVAVLRDPEAADDWIRHARVAVDLHGAKVEREASWLNVAGIAALERGDYDAASEDLERALALKAEAWGPGHPQVAVQAGNLAILRERQGDYAAAQRYYQQALDISVEAFGELHPRTARAYYDLGLLALSRGDAAACMQLQEKALGLKRKVLRPGHPSLAWSHDGMGQCALELGDVRAAREHHEQALEILLEELGPQHRAVAGVSINLGNALRRLGELEEARAAYQRGAKIMEATGAGEHIDVAAAWTGLALVEIDAKRWSEAEALLRRSRAVSLKTVEPSHPKVLDIDANLAKVVANRGELQAASDIVDAALRQAADLPAEDPRRRELEHMRGVLQDAQ